MGSDESSPFAEEMKTYVQTSNDEVNRITYYYSTEKDQYILLRKMTYNDRNSYEISKKKHEQRLKRPSNTNLQRLLKFYDLTKEEVCSTIHEIYAMWEHFPYTLSDDLQERYALNKQYSPKQMHIILANCVEGLESLQKENCLHEKLTLKAISLNEKLEAKVLDPLSMGSAENYERVSVSKETSKIYLSPEQCEALEMDTSCLKSYKNDVYTLGMILLETVLLLNMEDCYKEECRRINLIKVQENLGKLERKAGYEGLSHVLKMMLKKSKKDRADWPELAKIVTAGDNSLENRISPQVYNYHQNKISYGVPHSQPVPQPLHYQNITTHPINPQPYAFNAFNPQNWRPVNNPQLQPQPQPQVRRQVVYFPQGHHTLPIGQNYRPQQISPQLAPVTNSIVGQTNPTTFRPFEFMEKSMKPSPQKQTVCVHQFESMKKSAGYHKVEEKEEVKKFASPATNQGYLFERKTNFEEKTKPQFKSPNLQEFKPLNLQILNSDKEDSLRNDNPLLKDKNKLNVKNAESFTYEAETMMNQLGEKEKAKREEEERNREDQQAPKQGKEESEEYIIETFKQGSRYEGYKVNDMRNGEGKFFYQDGGMYDGHWKDNKMNGFGRLYYQNGNLAYEGEWVNDQFQGRGKLFNDQPERLEGPFDYENFDELEEYWEFYEGQFEGDLKEGRGKLRLSNGQYFVGCFHNDMIDGPGKYHCQDGRTVKGQWEKNQLLAAQSKY